MKFFKDIGNSIYGPAYYRELLTKSINHSFGYFFKLLFVFVFVSSILFTLQMVSLVDKLAPGFLAKGSDIYPAELVITLKDGAINTNTSEPYSIPLPTDIVDDEQVQSKFPKLANLIVFNTAVEADLDLYRQSNTLVLVGKHDIIMADKHGGISVQSVRDFPDFVVNKSKVDSWFGKLQSWLKLGVPLLVLVILPLIFIGLVIWWLIENLFWALIVWLVATVQGVKIGYGKAYQLSLHIITVLLLFRLIMMIVPILDVKVPFFGLIVVILVAAINLPKAKSRVIS